MKNKKPDIYDVEESNFQQLVLEKSANQLILVDFWAEWCAPCIVLTPILERLVSETDSAVALAKVEVDDNMKLAGKYRLRGFPTVLFIHQGVELERFSGAKPYHVLAQLLASVRQRIAQAPSTRTTIPE